jgi:hypothetical protein
MPHKTIMAPIAKATRPEPAIAPVWKDPAAFAVLFAAPVPLAPPTVSEVETAEDVVAAMSALLTLAVVVVPAPVAEVPGSGPDGLPVAFAVVEAPAPPGVAPPGPSPGPAPAPSPGTGGAKVGCAAPAGWHAMKS